MLFLTYVRFIILSEFASRVDRTARQKHELAKVFLLFSLVIRSKTFNCFLILCVGAFFLLCQYFYLSNLLIVSFDRDV